MNAKKLVGVVGNRLVGRTVWTEGMGYYPGGFGGAGDSIHRRASNLGALWQLEDGGV